ncbi:MAG: Panacea domain-containing protein [Janthinobacterium lividum]
MNTARSVANQFIRLANVDGRTLTPMSLMKLVYIAHGWSLALLHRALISDEIEAWQFGPVVPDLYQSMKRNGSAPVTQPLPSHGFFSSAPEYPGADDLSIIGRVYELYGALTGIQLSALTHQPGTPWSQTFINNRNSVIGDDLITEHFQQLARERQSVAA